MYRNLLVLISLIGCSWALDCQQIPSSSIFAGSDFLFPSNSSTFLPANFNCTYTIQAPVTSTAVLFATVSLRNQLKGQNDFIIVTDSFGGRKVLNYKSQSYLEYEVFPGKPMTVHVVTKSVLMNSAFSLHIRYGQAIIDEPQILATGDVLNYLDLSKIGAGKYNSAAFQANEQMSLQVAVDRKNYPSNYLQHVYVIDGDFYQQVQVSPLLNLVYYLPFVSTTNRLTLVSFQTSSYPDTAVIINPVSEVRQLGQLRAEVSNGIMSQISLREVEGGVDAVEILAVEAEQITIEQLFFYGTPNSNCTAQVLSGPPNDSSHLLFDLYQNQDQLPTTFNLKYLSVIAKNCGFSFSVISAMN